MFSYTSTPVEKATPTKPAIQSIPAPSAALEDSIYDAETQVDNIAFDTENQDIVVDYNPDEELMVSDKLF